MNKTELKQIRTTISWLFGNGDFKDAKIKIHDKPFVLKNAEHLYNLLNLQKNDSGFNNSKK